MKTIHEYFALTENEYEVTILSYMNIHREEYFSLIEMALSKYDLRSIERGKIELFSQFPTQFPSLSFGNIHEVKAVIGQMPRGMFEQLRLEISQHTHLKYEHFFVSEDGKVPQCTQSKPDDEALLKTAMGDHSMDKAVEGTVDYQELVGQKSVENIMKDMDERRKANEEESVAVCESKKYRATHSLLKEYTGKYLRKGIYEFRIIDGEIVLGDKTDSDKSEFVKTLDQLKEELSPKVQSFSQKYKIDSFLKEYIGDDDGNEDDSDDVRHYYGKIIHAFNKRGIELAKKAPFDKDPHTVNPSSVAILYVAGDDSGHIQVWDFEITLSDLNAIASDMNWKDIKIIASNKDGQAGINLEFKCR